MLIVAKVALMLRNYNKLSGIKRWELWWRDCVQKMHWSLWIEFQEQRAYAIFYCA